MFRRNLPRLVLKLPWWICEDHAESPIANCKQQIFGRHMIWHGQRRHGLPLIMAAPTAFATAHAMDGGNALPICRHMEVLLPQKCQGSGKPCNRAIMRGVSIGKPMARRACTLGLCPPCQICGGGASGPGAVSATPKASVASPNHASLPRVALRSAPPCFFEPPATVGA
jgi:hypothetical protein